MLQTAQPRSNTLRFSVITLIAPRSSGSASTSLISASSSGCLSAARSPSLFMSLQTAEECAQMKDVPYLSAVGTLQHLVMCTHPDIHSIAVLFGASPGMQHWKACKAPLPLPVRHYRPQAQLSSNANHGGNKDNRQLTGGYLVCVRSGAVSWSSQQQPIVRLSTAEAEFVAAVKLIRRPSRCATLQL